MTQRTKKSYKQHNMKLLIITQIIDINDPILGFFVRWVKEFAKHYEKITVICLEKGKHNLPENVKVLSLGKEEGGPPYRKTLRYIVRFYTYIWRERKNYDSVFVHMNPEYVVLGGILWRLLGKQISLWYTHRQVNIKLRIATLFSNQIFSASEKSFRLKTKKLNVVGHGIDVAQFRCPSKEIDDSLRIVSVGRITQIKGCDTLVRAAKELKESGVENLSIIFVGDIVTSEDEKYKEELIHVVEDFGLSNNVTFKGSLRGEELLKEYCEGDIFVNLTPTGGVDKVVLEAMASGRVVFSSNEAFSEYFGIYADRLIFPHKDYIRLAEMIKNLLSEGDYQQIAEFLHEQAQKHSSVDTLILHIVDYME